MTTALVELRRRLAEVSDVSRAAGVLGWDQRVTMPPLGTEARADQLATLGRIDETAPAWTLARGAVEQVLADAGRGGAPTVLRWLASFLVSDATAQSIDADVEVLMAGLPRLAALPQDALPRSG